MAQGSPGPTEGAKLHTVVGIALNSVLIPGLKPYVDNKLEKHYNELVEKYRIDTENSTLDVSTIKEENLGLNIHEKNGFRNVINAAKLR